MADRDESGPEVSYVPPSIERRESIEAMLMPAVLDPTQFSGGS